MATFTISATVATFTAIRERASQAITDVETFACQGLFATEQEFLDAQALITSKYHVHSPLGGNIVIDIARGAGAGTLVVGGRGTATAILTDLRRSAYLRSTNTIADLSFILTTAWA